MKKVILLILAMALVALTGACSSISTAPDQVGLHYDGGPFTSVKYKNCVSPSTKEYDNIADKHFKYPAGQRTFDFTGAKDENGRLEAESEPYVVVDSEGVELTVPGILTFTLNTECDTLRTFHERIGIKYGAWEGEGWDNALVAYLGNPLKKAMDQASQAYTWREMLQSQDVRDAWETEVGRLTRQFALDQAGYDFFCSPNFTGEGACGDFALTIQKPGIPQNIADALAETAAEVERNQQAIAAQDRINTEAASLQALVDVLGPEGAVLYQAIQNGQISVIPVPTGTGVNITPPAPPASE